MPLPENFFEEEKNKQLYKDDLYDPSSIFPDFSESENIEEKQSLYDSIGEGLWSLGAHFISASTMGATEFISPTESWEEKTTSERIGAAVGEAAGMFVPMGLIGKGIRGVAAFGKQGSKTIAKQAIKNCNLLNCDGVWAYPRVGSSLNAHLQAGYKQVSDLHQSRYGINCYVLAS